MVNNAWKTSTALISCLALAFRAAFRYRFFFFVSACRVTAAYSPIAFDLAFDMNAILRVAVLALPPSTFDLP
jgi:hypothetical protein